MPNLKSKLPYFALGVAGYALLKFGLLYYEGWVGPKGPTAFKRLGFGYAAFANYCLPADGDIEKQKLGLQLLGGTTTTSAINNVEYEYIRKDSLGDGSIAYQMKDDRPVLCQVAIDAKPQEAQELLFSTFSRLEKWDSSYGRVDIDADELKKAYGVSLTSDFYIDRADSARGSLFFAISPLMVGSAEQTILTSGSMQ